MLYGTNAATPSGSSPHSFSYLDVPKNDKHLAALIPHAANAYISGGGGGYYTPQGGGGAPPGGGTAVGSVNNPTYHPIGYNQSVFSGSGLRFRYIPTGQGPRISFKEKNQVTQFPGSGVFSGMADDLGLSGFFGDVGNFFKRVTTPPAPIRRFEQKELGGVITKTGRVLASGTVGAASGAAAGFLTAGPIGALVGGAAGATYGTAKGIYGVVTNAPQGRTMYQTILPSLAIGTGSAYLASVYSTPAQIANVGGVGGKLDLLSGPTAPGGSVIPQSIASQGGQFYSGSMLTPGSGFGLTSLASGGSGIGSTLLTLTGLKLLAGQGGSQPGQPGIFDFGGSQPQIYPIPGIIPPGNVPYNAGGGGSGASGDGTPQVIQAGMDTTQMVLIGGVAVTAIYMMFKGKKRR